MSAQACFDLLRSNQDFIDLLSTQKPSIPPTILDYPWSSWGSRPSSPFDVEQFLQGVSIPPIPAQLERIKCYIHNTSITPFGYGYSSQYSEVLRGRLWISEDLNCTDSLSLRNFGITHVVSIDQKELTGCTCLEENSTIYSRLEALNDIRGDRPPVGVIDDAVAFIDNALRTSPFHRVLIYCGAEWSQSVATACLMNETGCSFGEAQKFALRHRGDTRPNPAIDEAVHQWWSLSQLRVDFPQGRGYRKFKWAREKKTNS